MPGKTEYLYHAIILFCQSRAYHALQTLLVYSTGIKFLLDEKCTACPRKSGPQQMECPPTNSIFKEGSYIHIIEMPRYSLMKMCVRLAR